MSIKSQLDVGEKANYLSYEITESDYIKKKLSQTFRRYFKSSLGRQRKNINE